LLIVTVALAAAMPVAADSRDDDLIVLRGASSTEGVAIGRGSTFYAGDVFRGDIFRGDLEHDTADVFIHAPAGRNALGMKVDVHNNLLFVAGGFTGQAYVYDTRTGATVAKYQFAPASANAIINDVTLTRNGAWFTDSAHAQLFFIPVGPGGALGSFSTLAVTGPAGDTSAPFNLNGIAATGNGSTLIVAHSGTGKLYTVNPTTGASAVIGGVSVPNVDGILFEAGRLWAVQNAINQISTFRLSRDLTSGELLNVIHSASFEFPTTMARHGDELLVANAKFDTGFPPTAKQFEVVIIERSESDEE